MMSYQLCSDSLRTPSCLITVALTQSQRFGQIKLNLLLALTALHLQQVRFASKLPSGDGPSLRQNDRSKRDVRE